MEDLKSSKNKKSKDKEELTITKAAIALSISFAVVIIGIQLKVGMTAPLIAGILTASIFGLYFGHEWTELQEAMTKGITNALPAIIILLLVGMIIGIWIIGGTVPTMVYLGLKLINPKWFLMATFVMCAIVSTATGTSFGTVGTIGLALIGIGQGLGIPLSMVAGAIVAGAYFGDKMSPLSDTTNVAPAMAGASLFDHIGSMLYTTVPAVIVSLIVYLALGFKYGGQNTNIQDVQQILTVISESFNVSIWTLVPPLLIIVMSIKRVPAIAALAIGTVFSIVWAVLMQGEGFVSVINVSMNGYVSSTGFEAIDSLFTRGGLNSMLVTDSLILVAAAFGGILECMGVLSTVVETALKKINGTGGLILSVLASCYLVLLVSGNVMMAIILPGRTFKSIFEKRGIEARVLSRTLEDAATIGGALIPWSVAGLLISGLLKVPVVSFAPYAVLNWVVPIFSIIYGFTGFAIFRTDARGEFGSNSSIKAV